MKTLRTGKILRSLLTVALLSTLFVSCGNDNTTGQSSRNSLSGGLGGFGAYGSMNSGYLSTIANENRCAQGGQRSITQVQVNQPTTAGGLFVGVTSFGDIAIIQNQVMVLHICPRAGLSGQGRLLQAPIVNNSLSCPIDEISSAQMELTGQVNYRVNFRPISVPQMGIQSSLCTMNNNQMYY
jgi:hypothetical protein